MPVLRAQTTDNLDRIRSGITGMVWPAVPDAAATRALAMQFQLGDTQWWPFHELERAQLQQLQLVLRHAASVPFYRDRFDRAGFTVEQPLTLQGLRKLPPLTRGDVQAAGERLRAPRIPDGHGSVSSGETSGSTGRPVVFHSSELEDFYWNAFTLRDHDWHRRDFGASLAVIRYAPENAELRSWGPPVNAIYASGPASLLRIDTDIEEQIAWLRERNPGYLLSYASNLHELARVCLERGIGFPRLREVRSVSEVVRPELRALVRAAWGVPLIDVYTAKEMGYLALQCPGHDHYHVQMENVLVEIVDEAGAPCAPGRPGKVLVTCLHKFAMPLVRYEIGDYAVPGEPCACGRGLTVIREILGRARNMLRLPTGERRWPLCDLVKEPDMPGILQYQYVQKEIDRIEVHLVVGAQFPRESEPRLIEIIHRRLGHPFRVDLIYRDDIPRSASGKYEDFRCELDDGA